jgi:hypothetical protein
MFRSPGFTAVPKSAAAPRRNRLVISFIGILPYAPD